MFWSVWNPEVNGYGPKRNQQYLCVWRAGGGFNHNHGINFPEARKILKSDNWTLLESRIGKLIPEDQAVLRRCLERWVDEVNQEYPS